MITGFLALVNTLLGIFFPSKSAEKVARDDGATSGIAQQRATDESQVLKDVQDAKAAVNTVDAAGTGGVPNTNTDGFRRD